GGRPCAWRNAVGDGARGHPAGDAVWSGRGGDSRARARAGRGDRGDTGDRRRHAHRLVALPPGGHSGEQDRLELPGSRLGSRDLVADVPRGNPARARSDCQPRRSGDRAPLRSFARSAVVNRYRRRRIVNRLMEVIATVAALVAVAVLAIVVVSVAKRAAGAISWDFFTKPQALFGQ